MFFILAAPGMYAAPQTQETDKKALREQRREERRQKREERREERQQRKKEQKKRAITKYTTLFCNGSFSKRKTSLFRCVSLNPARYNLIQSIKEI